MTKCNIRFKVETVRQAFEMQDENEFKVEGKKYPYPGAYLMKNSFSKKKKKTVFLII